MVVRLAVLTLWREGDEEAEENKTWEANMINRKRHSGYGAYKKWYIFFLNSHENILGNFGQSGYR